MADAYANPFRPSPQANPFTNTGGMFGADPTFYFNQVPEAGYWAWLYGLNPGYWGTTNQARFAQGQYVRYQNRFAAQAAANPNLEWYPWLQGQPDAGKEYELLSPDQRGDQFRFTTPRAKWVIGGG